MIKKDSYTKKLLAVEDEAFSTCKARFLSIIQFDIHVPFCSMIPQE